MTVLERADLRAGQARAVAARWHWVRERWHADPHWWRGTPTPERYDWPAETLVAGLRRVLVSPVVRGGPADREWHGRRQGKGTE